MACVDDRLTPRRAWSLALRVIVCAAALAAGGCAGRQGRPWLGPNEPAVLHQPGPLPSSDPALSGPDSARAGSVLAGRLAAAKPTPDPQALSAVMGELHAIGAVDPAAQDRLVQSLERTNPSLWPEVMNNFRAQRTAPISIAGQSPDRAGSIAGQAFHQSPLGIPVDVKVAPEGMQNGRLVTGVAATNNYAIAGPAPSSPLDAAGAMPLTARLNNATPPTEPWSALAVPPITKNDQVVLKDWPQPPPDSPSEAAMLATLTAASAPLVAATSAPATAASGGDAPPFQPGQPGEPQLLTAVQPNAAVPAAVQPAAFTPPIPLISTPAQPHYPTSTAPTSIALANVPPANMAPATIVPAVSLAPAAGSVTPASFAPAPLNQEASLAAAITSLESTLQEPIKNPSDAPRHAYLRLLYLAAGRREDALRPIAGLSPTEQEYWDKQLRAMATWLDVERIPDAPRRAAEATQRLNEATARLAQLGSLGLRNMAFCTEISSYGVYTRFKDNSFAPGQQVLLYSEVENFKSVETHRGFHTVLKSGYQIVDMTGAVVFKEDPQVMEEYCQNSRRDYFVRYRLHLPKAIASGRYRLQLTVEDTLGEKSGLSNIEFTVRAP